MGILRIKDLNKGMALKQGDKTTLKFELYDASNEPLVLLTTGKVYFKYKGQIYAEEDVTIDTENVATFKLNTILPSGKYYLEFVIADRVFPSQDIDTFHVTSSVLGQDIQIIEINGVEKVADAVIAKLDPFLEGVTQAELTRQEAEGVREAQEEARGVAEGQRVESEDGRQTAEQQRVTADAGREAKLTSKADKSYVDTELAKKTDEATRIASMVKLENLIVNGDFSEGTKGWITNAGITLEVNNNLLTATTQRGFSSPRVYQEADDYFVGKKYYIKAKVKVLHTANFIRLRLMGSVNIGTVQNADIKNNPVVGEEYILEGISTPPSDGSGKLIVDVNVLFTNSDAGNKFQLVELIAINLTEAFGAGNEPTKEQMDELMQHIGYFNGTTLIPQSAILAMISQKANKKQEEWITPTLLNGWTSYADSPFQFRKDQFGRVHFQGRLNPVSKTDIHFCILPEGYKPANPAYLNWGHDSFIVVLKNGGCQNYFKNWVSMEGFSYSTI